MPVVAFGFPNRGYEMIYIRLMGGLGNQMFQYAFGKSLSVKNNLKLGLDLTYLSERPESPDYTIRDFDLAGFNIDCQAKKFLRFHPRLKRFMSRIERTIRERSFNYDHDLSIPMDGAIYIGYFQSHKYFLDIRDALLELFKPRLLSEELNQSLLDLKKNSVSIHVRRGDYVTNSKSNSFHGLCSLEYYHEGISFILEKIDDPTFYVFSDDIDWVKENLKLKHSHKFISFIKSSPCDELYLMSRCHHNIIANSSFSWWAAWLNNNPEKIVVAPKNWFKDPTIDTSDLIPSSWIRL